MPRKRNYAAEYAARQARARAQGFTGYYGKRVRAGASPSAPAPKGERLRQARGHAGAADLTRTISSGRVEAMTQEAVSRDEAGRVTTVRVTVMLADGSQRSFTVRGRDLVDPAKRAALVAAVTDAGSDIYMSASLDLVSQMAVAA